MKKLLISLLILTACDFEPIPPVSTTSTTLSTTTTTLEAPKTGEVVVKKIPLSIHKRPFDYKIDSKGIGHLIVGEKDYFRYQTFDGKAWSAIEVLKDSSTKVIPYATKDTRFRSPHITSMINAKGENIIYVIWGEKESDGVLMTSKSGSTWNAPKKILGNQWIEYSNMDTFKDELYLASVTVNGQLTFSKFNGTDFVAYKTMDFFNKEVNTYAGSDNLWFASRFSNGFIYPASNPDQFIAFKGASIPQVVVPSGTDYHAAYIVGDSKKLDGKQYYWPDKIVYKSQAKEVTIYDFPAPTDAELKAWKTLSDAWMQVCGDVAITTIGGHASIVYDIKNTLYMAQVKGTQIVLQTLGQGQCPLIKQRANSAELIVEGDFMHELEVK